jgi:hypothetical protein
MDIDQQYLFGAIEPGNVEALANHFLEEYYSNIIHNGWNSVQYFYSPDATIICNTQIYNGGHEFLNALSQDYIRRANYGESQASWYQIDESKMIINVFGEIQLVSFTGNHSEIIYFSDSFVIRAYPDSTYAVTHHTFNFN